MTLLLARHAQTVWHRENRYAGAASDIDLTPTGVEQARRLGRWVGHHQVHAVISSPVRRAVETADPCARAAGVPLRIDAELREVGFGVAEGRTLAELDPDLVARFTADPVAHPFPGAEPPEGAARRCAHALRAIAEDHPGRTVLVVGHKTVLRLGLCLLLGLPPAGYRRVLPRLDNGALTEIDIPADGGPAALLSLNVPVPGTGPACSRPEPPTPGATPDVPVGPRPCSTTEELS